jgi:uncharacterized membrane protein YbjE (DUF340 family)
VIPLSIPTAVKYAGGLLVVVLGLRRGVRTVPPWVWLLAAVVVFSSLLGGPASTPRFRVPVEPLLSIAAAGGWALLGGAVWARREDAHMLACEADG